jgi:hypothetical protein
MSGGAWLSCDLQHRGATPTLPSTWARFIEAELTESRETLKPVGTTSYLRETWGTKSLLIHFLNKSKPHEALRMPRAFRAVVGATRTHTVHGPRSLIPRPIHDNFEGF